MMLPLKSVWVVIILLTTNANAREDLCTQPGVINVITDITAQGCDETSLTCHSLQAALDFVNESSAQNMTICLPKGQHRINKQTDFGKQGLRLVGIENVTTVECEYNAKPLEEGFDYTWHFNQSSEVHLENIHFTSCPYPFRLLATHNVTVKDCTFKNFSEAVMDIFNCESVLLERSIFHNNVGTGILLETYRGNTGGVGIGYHDYPQFFSPPNVKLSNCNFINNSALATSTLLSPERAVSRSVFTGRGGGLGIFIDESNQNISLQVSDCKFIGNNARSFGGGVFIIINGYNTQHLLTFTNAEIVSNTGRLGGAGVQLSFLSASNISIPPHSVLFSDCNFEDNVGEAGGGIYIFTSFVGSHGIYFKLERCNFTNNKGPGSIDEFGAAVGVSLLAIFEQRVTSERHDIIDCTFTGNSGSNGIVSTGYSPIKFSGNNTFVNNTGAAVRVLGSLVDFSGHVRFINNSVFSEGALSLLSFGQMRMNKGLSIKFNGNIGRLGASITVATPDTLAAFTRLLYNSACFALYEDPLVAPTEWENVSVDFTDNSAVLGSALYLSRVGHCSWFSQTPPFFRQTFVRDWPVWTYGRNTNTGYPDQYNPDYYVGTRAREISVNTHTVDSWPGRQYLMSVTGIDQFDHVTSTNARFFLSSKGKNQLDTTAPMITFNPEIVVIAGAFERGLLTDQFPMSYSLSNEANLGELTKGPSIVVEMEEPFETLPISAGNFSIRAQECPGGYQLTSIARQNEQNETTSTGFTCQCVDTPEIVACEPDQDGVIVQDGFWAGYAPMQASNLFLYPCPPGYCQCTLNSSLGPDRCVHKYSQSDQDLQCIAEREGLLCATCRNNSGVSVLLDMCVSCSDGYLGLIVLVVLLDVIVYLAITLIDRPIPNWIYPFIFYVQMAPFVSAFFPESFETVGVYMTYVKSALGFYFVYDFCLHSSLSPLVSYFLRYVPTLVAIIVFPSVWLVRKYLFKKKSLKHHGYWLIVVLLYPQLVHTSLTILNCPQLPDSNGSFVSRWFVDSSVQCFNGWHLALSLLAIALLVVSLLIIAAAIVLTCKKPDLFKKFIPPLIAAYNENVQWWSGLELGRRLLVLILLTAFPKNTVYAIQALVVILSTYGYLLPYKSMVANVFEVTLLLNLMTLMLLDATPLIRESLFTFGTGVSVSPISWLLFSFYYLPVILLVGLITALALHQIVRFCIKCQKTRHSDADIDTDYLFVEKERASTTQSVHISELGTDEGEAVVMDFVTQYYNREE